MPRAVAHGNILLLHLRSLLEAEASFGNSTAGITVESLRTRRLELAYCLAVFPPDELASIYANTLKPNLPAQRTELSVGPRSAEEAHLLAWVQDTLASTADPSVVASALLAAMVLWQPTKRRSSKGSNSAHLGCWATTSPISSRPQPRSRMRRTVPATAHTSTASSPGPTSLPPPSPTIQRPNSSLKPSRSPTTSSRATSSTGTSETSFTGAPASSSAS